MNKFLPVLLLASTLSIPAENAVSAPQRLWPGDAPGARGSSLEDVPTLTPYLPDPARATGAAMLVIPGGGYAEVVTPHEGTAYALWLNQQGIAAFVLKYRLGTHGYRHPSMLQDAARALRTIRANARDWHVDPARIGVMGSSAGGHLSATLMTHFDLGDPASADPIEQESSRPDLGVLCYPVITMRSFTHAGSRANLLGENPSEELVSLLSNDGQVTTNTPPAFIFHTWADTVVPVENALQFATALRQHGVAFDLHIYQDRDHGIGLGDDVPPFRRTHPWVADLKFWLQEMGFASTGRRLLIAPSTTNAQLWRYTTAAPVGDAWTQGHFEDGNWEQAPGAFGSAGTVGMKLRTDWTSSDIWMRRTVVLPHGPVAHPALWLCHDDDVEIYINGHLAAKATGWTTGYVLLDLAQEAREQIKPGAAVTLAVHCHQRDGGQGVDVGLVDVTDP